MPRDTKSAKLRPFAHQALEELVRDLYTEGVSTSAQQVLGALVLAAQRSPVEAVAAVVKTYIAREARELSPPP